MDITMNTFLLFDRSNENDNLPFGLLTNKCYTMFSNRPTYQSNNKFVPQGRNSNAMEKSNLLLLMHLAVIFVGITYKELLKEFNIELVNNWRKSLLETTMGNFRTSACNLKTHDNLTLQRFIFGN